MSWLFKTSPTSLVSSSSSEEEVVEQSPKGLAGVRNDLTELGGSLKSGLSKLASSLLPFPSNRIEEEEEDEDEDEKEEEEAYVAGITEEVIAFVEKIATRPECWTESPLPLTDDFRMSDVQKEHALAIAEMVPSLATLKASLQSEIGGNRFWFIYFILLLPRLSEGDCEILSSSQIVEARNLVLKKIKDLRNENISKSEDPRTSTSSEDDRKSSATEESPSRQFEVTDTIDLTKSSSIQDQEKRLEDRDIDTNTSENNQERLEHEEDDFSFSELEDDDSDRSSRASASKQPEMNRTPSDTSDWVRLPGSSTTQAGSQRGRQSFSHDQDSDVESNGWLTVDESD